MFSGQKTYITGAVAIIGFIAAYLTGEATLDTTLQAVLTAVLGMTIRHGVSTETAKKAASVILLALLLLPAMGCTAMQGQAATQTDAWYELRADLSAANRLYITYGNTADLSDPDEARRVIDWGEKLQKARALLAQARPLADQPGGGFDAIFDQIEAILIELAEPRSELRDDRATSPDPRAAWRLRGSEGSQPATGPDGSRRGDRLAAA